MRPRGSNNANDHPSGELADRHRRRHLALRATFAFGSAGSRGQSNPHQAGVAAGGALMSGSRPITDWLTARGLAVADVVAATGLDRRVVEAIAAGRYTPSPEQRRALATAVNVE